MATPVQKARVPKIVSGTEPLTEWVIEKALHLNREWAHEGRALPIAINLSARNLRWARTALDNDSWLLRSSAVLALADSPELDYRSIRSVGGVLAEFATRMYGPGTPVRLRPSYFPFVEPGAEVDIACVFCKRADGTRAGCSLCKHTGWIEILGCGMIHPVVFEACGIDPERWTGFALGMGLERIAMLRYGIPNIKLYFENDPRFLAQF